MALVAQPSPALHAGVLRAALTSDTWTHTSVGYLIDLIDSLTSDEAAAFPEAVAGVLPVLRNDPERLRLLAEAAVALDLYEAADSLTDLADGTGDHQLLLAAAALGGNPAVRPDLRRRLTDMVDGDRLGLIRLNSGAGPTTATEAVLYQQQWPGSRIDSREPALAPVVVLDTSLRADAVHRLAVRLVGSGASVRRLAPQHGVPDWFGAQTVLVCTAPARSRILSSYPTFPEGRILVPEKVPLRDREMAQILSRIDRSLAGGPRLHLSVLRQEAVTAVWDPSVYTLGVYSLREASVLTGAHRSSMYDLLKKRILSPIDSGGGVALISFREVVAVRTWAFLKASSPRRVSSSVVSALAGFAGDALAVSLGVTSDGHVLVDRGDGWVNVLSGEQPLGMELTDLDDVFRPFSYGSGRTLDLLHASRNTRLHPAILRGTPYLDSHRISAKALAAVHKRGGDRAIRQCYPELGDRDVDDTVSVGERLLSRV